MDDLTQATRLFVITLSAASFLSLILGWPDTLRKPFKDRMLYISLLLFALTIGYGSLEQFILDIPGGVRLVFAVIASAFGFVAISLPDRRTNRRRDDEVRQ